MQEIRSILALGFSVRHIVCSGQRAGYEMSAADAFGDVDTRGSARNFYLLDPDDLHKGLTILEDVKGLVDGVIMGSGFESADYRSLSDTARGKILGNRPEKTRVVADKVWLAACLDELGIPHPRTVSGRAITALCAQKRRIPLAYPVVAKPAQGGGGTANFFCQTEKELIRSAKARPDFLYQDYVKGQHASVSVLLSNQEAVSICLNEQLLGMKSLSAPGPLVYCGNITPMAAPRSTEVCKLAEDLTAELGLIGSNGVDVVLSDDGPVVIEVNPRVQGSLDTVELATGLNLVDAHVRAVAGELPARIAVKRYAAKMIVFAARDGLVTADLTGGGSGIVDIPARGRTVHQGEPIATGIGVGRSRADACTTAMARVARIQAAVN
ncbi:MAG TPA: ATP-grasp domain-containing protein [Methanomicrobia archaeon]|nr:ATP-grasp domain-containing protein [Methanomicrobia archaeon]